MKQRIIETPENLDELKTIVLSTTAKARIENPEPKAPEVNPENEPKSDLERKMREAAKHDNKPDAAFYAALVGAIEGREVPVVEDDEDEKAPEYNYPRLSAIVPLEEMGDHDYPVGAPAVIYNMEKRFGIKQDGERGNHHHGLWRYATDDEIAAFFVALPVEKTDQILKYFED